MGNSRGMRSRSRGYPLPRGNERRVSGLQLELENVVSGGTGGADRRVRVLRVSVKSRFRLVGRNKDTSTLRLQRLQELEHWIKESAGGDKRERVRADAVAVAIDH